MCLEQNEISIEIKIIYIVYLALLKKRKAPNSSMPSLQCMQYVFLIDYSRYVQA